MKQQLKESGKKNKTNADNKKNTILSAPETAQSWLIVVFSAVVLTTGHTSRGRSAQGHLCMKETPRNSPSLF